MFIERVRIWSNPRGLDPKGQAVATVSIINPGELSIESRKERAETLAKYKSDARALYDLWQHTLPSGTYQYLAQLLARDVDTEFLDANPDLKLK